MIIKVILVAIFIPVFVVSVIAVIKKQKNKELKSMSDNRFIVTIPNIVIIIGMMCTLMSLLVLLGFTFLKKELPHLIFYFTFGFFFWLGMYLVLKTISFKIIVKDEEITVFSVFRKTYTFTFSEIIWAERQVKKNQIKSEVKKEYLVGFE